jgi:DNA-binding CsgD family transcriptional regulator
VISHSARFVSPRIIGRESELKTLGQALQAAQRAEGHCILMAGEAGVGKSRLLDELRQRAVGQGFVVLQGHCFEQDVSFPYSLWINALRDRFAWSEPSDIGKLLGPLASEFVKFLPELALILPGVAPTPALDPESEKRRLFEALARFTTHLAGANPLLIVLEDLHWCDEASLDFLRTFTHRVADHPILLIATYRSDEQPPQLARFLAQANRERGADHLVLAPLTRNQAAEMTRQVLKLERLPGDELLDLIMQRTEGNPFFIEEILRTMTEAGNSPASVGAWKRQSAGELQVPSSVYDAVQRRLQNLLPETLPVLRLAAAMGQRLSFELLRQISSKDETELLAAIKDLLAAQLLVEESADQFAFRHALTRDAVYRGTLLRERQALHKQIGETMERFWAATSGSHAAELAYHFDQAAVWDKAFKYSQRAAEHAQALYAPLEGVEHLTRAVEAGRHLLGAPLAGLHRSRGNAYFAADRFESARTDLETALALAQAGGDRMLEWQCLLDLGFVWTSRDFTRSGDYLQHALELARALEDPDAVARSLNRMGNWFLNLGRAAEGRPLHQEALGIYQELKQEQGVAETLELLGLTELQVNDYIRAGDCFRRAADLFRRLGDRRGLFHCLKDQGLEATLDVHVMSLPDLAACEESLNQALQIARDIGWLSGEADALTFLGTTLAGRGEYGAALRSLLAALEMAEEIEHRRHITTAQSALGHCYLELMAWPEAQRSLEQALELARQTSTGVLVGRSLILSASVCVATGEFERAEALLESVPAGSAETPFQRWARCVRGQSALARGEPDGALEIAQELIGSTVNLKVGDVVPRLWQLRGDALAALSRTAEAIADLQAAFAAALAQGRRPLACRIQISLGWAYRRGRRRDESVEAFEAARRMIEELGANIPEGRLRENFLSRASWLVPAATPASRRRVAKRQYGGLTGREREIAALIAQGKSNREIAQALVLSERTVAAHIGNILSKLGFASRVHIAAWAIETGLTKLQSG